MLWVYFSYWMIERRADYFIFITMMTLFLFTAHFRIYTSEKACRSFFIYWRGVTSPLSLALSLAHSLRPPFALLRRPLAIAHYFSHTASNIFIYIYYLFWYFIIVLVDGIYFIGTAWKAVHHGLHSWHADMPRKAFWLGHIHAHGHAGSCHTVEVNSGLAMLAPVFAVEVCFGLDAFLAKFNIFRFY